MDAEARATHGAVAEASAHTETPDHMTHPCSNGVTSAPVSFPGPEGVLEGLVDCASGTKKSLHAVLCHPLSTHGGTMQNKVVHTLAKCTAANGVTALRFNFRGVGKSAGEFDQGTGETDDTLAAVRWLQEAESGHDLILGGFSFGSYVAMQAAAVQRPVAMISVAPPVRMFEFATLHPPSCPWLMIQGDEDEIVDATDVINWVRTLKQQPELHIMEGAGHFFHGKLVELREICNDFISQVINKPM